jgi:hypothetical protein
MATEVAKRLRPAGTRCPRCGGQVLLQDVALSRLEPGSRVTVAVPSCLQCSWEEGEPCREA